MTSILEKLNRIQELEKQLQEFESQKDRAVKVVSGKVDHVSTFLAGIPNGLVSTELKK